MRIAARFRRVFTPLSALIAIAALAVPCHGVTMRVTAGFDGVMKSTQWTPLAVQLANPSEDDIEGTLVVSEPEGLTTPMPICTAQVNLPAHSTKLYHAYVRLPGYGGKVKVALARGYGVLATKEVKINAAADEDRVIVTIGERAARLSFMQGENITVSPRLRPGMGARPPAQATIHAGSLSPRMLPDRPAAYEGADVIVISGLSPESTDPNALKAICEWVASGGTLIVSTGPDYRGYINAFYDEILPVRISGAASLPGITSISSMGGTAFPSGPAAIAASTLKPGIGRALHSENGMPIVAERDYGAGRVVFLAFDVKAAPFKDWDGQIRFWKIWITATTDGPILPTEARFAGDAFYGNYSGYQSYDQNAGLASVVMQTPSIKTPSITAVGLFLVAYLVILVPVNYAVLRAKRRLELAWLTTPAIVLLFTVGAYAIGYTMKGGSLRLCEATLIEGSSNARFARTVTNASIFSPARRSYSLTVADPSAISQAVPMSRDDEPPVTFLADTSVMDGVGMAMWSSKTFEAVGGMDLGGVIESNLKIDGGKLSGTVRNNTAMDLRDCKITYGDTSMSIARLAKGQSARVELRPSSSSPQGMPQSPGYSAEEQVSQRLKHFVDTSAPASGPVLVGFADTKGVFDVADGRAQADRAICCVFHLSYDQGSVMSIAPGMVTAWQVSGSRNGSPGGNASGMLGGYLYNGQTFVGAYRLPLPTEFKVTSLKVVGSTNRNSSPGAGKGVVNASVLNCVTGKWDPISVPSGASLPTPANYVNTNHEVKLRFRSTNSSNAEVSFGVAAEAKRL